MDRPLRASRSWTSKGGFAIIGVSGVHPKPVNAPLHRLVPKGQDTRQDVP